MRSSYILAPPRTKIVLHKSNIFRNRISMWGCHRRNVSNLAIPVVTGSTWRASDTTARGQPWTAGISGGLFPKKKGNETKKSRMKLEQEGTFFWSQTQKSWSLRTFAVKVLTDQDFSFWSQTNSFVDPKMIYLFLNISSTTFDQKQAVRNFCCPGLSKIGLSEGLKPVTTGIPKVFPGRESWKCCTLEVPQASAPVLCWAKCGRA